jgi:hypothetical protein
MGRPAEQPLIPLQGGIDIGDSNACENAIDGRVFVGPGEGVVHPRHPLAALVA